MVLLVCFEPGHAATHNSLSAERGTITIDSVTIVWWLTGIAVAIALAYGCALLHSNRYSMVLAETGVI
jgi:hypothetical protein